MVKYRRRFDILADIVNVAGQGARRTRIMYFANLSHLLLKKYLKQAVQGGLLRPVGEQFAATEKGEEFVKKYQQFSGKYSRVEADVKALQGEIEELERICLPRRNGDKKNARRSRLAIQS